MTPLDEAMEAARKDPDKGHVFYDAFLNCDLLLPVKQEEDKESSFKELDDTEKFHPLFLKYEEKRVLPVFDTLDKLKHWAEKSKLDYVIVRGHKLTKMVESGVEMAVNLGTDHPYHFTGELLEMLIEHMQVITPEKLN